MAVALFVGCAGRQSDGPGPGHPATLPPPPATSDLAGREWPTDLLTAPPPDRVFGPLLEPAGDGSADSATPPGEATTPDTVAGFAFEGIILPAPPDFDPLVPTTLPMQTLPDEGALEGVPLPLPASLSAWEDDAGGNREAETAIRVVRLATPGGGIEEWTGDERARVLVRLADGSIATARSIDTTHSAVTQFEPPLPLLTPDQVWGEPVMTEATVRVERLGDPELLLDRGEARFSSQVVGLQAVRLPSGEVLTALRVETALDLDLGRARVTSGATVWLVPGLGPVARDEHERVRVFGPLGWSRRLRAVWSGGSPAE